MTTVNDPVARIWEEAWAAFDAWREQHDPYDEMDLLEQIDAYARDTARAEEK